MENTSFNGPDQEILGYFQSVFTREYVADLSNALSVLYESEYEGIQESLVSLLNGPEADNPDTLSSLMVAEIVKALDRLLELQGVKMFEEASIQHKNMVATTLGYMATMEDPVPYLRILETDLTSVEKLARLCQVVVAVDELVILDAVEEIEDNTLSKLYTTLEKQEAKQRHEEVEENHSKLIENFKLFCQYLGHDHIGYSMLQNDFKIGLESRTYLPFIAVHFNSIEVDVIAKNILSYFFISKDAWTSPLEHFRRESELLLRNPRNIIPVEAQMRKTLEGFEQYKRARYEQV